MRNGYFQLEKRKDGAYIVIYPPEEGGELCDATEVTRYLDGYNIDYAKNIVYDTVKNANEVLAKRDARITTLSVGSFDESLVISVLHEAMSAEVRFYPPATGGREFTKDDIVHQLARQGVKFGIREDEIDKYIKDRHYCTNYVLAVAEPPVEGHDAVIEYHFNTDLTRKPKLNEDGSVDFHQLDNVSHVEAGQVIATLTPADMGKPGTDVMGRPIKPQKVAVKFLQQVRNAKLSEDRLQLISEVNGHASIVEGKIFISDTYVVPANVDPTTGDIMYNGNVHVNGNVNTGYRVEASGDIIVDGIVEGAELIAGGQIVLKRGIQGTGRGMLKAGTNIVSKFIESANAEAGGFIQTESIMHSNVTAGGEIVSRGKKGFITGSTVRSGRNIQAKTIGSSMGTDTSVEVGVNMALTEEQKRLEAELSEINANIDKAAKIIAFISNKIKNREQLPPEKLEQFQQLSARTKELEKRADEINNRINEIMNELENSTGGYILVDDIIYPGCKVTVSNVTTFIRKETKHCRLVRDGADVRVAAY
ncbi:MAG: FapA family protein [Lachnospiraceae bacterium]|nr:FapA family protein [Lachnospiraceae bacterium]